MARILPLLPLLSHGLRARLLAPHTLSLVPPLAPPAPLRPAPAVASGAASQWTTAASMSGGGPRPRRTSTRGKGMHARGGRLQELERVRRQGWGDDGRSAVRAESPKSNPTQGRAQHRECADAGGVCMRACTGREEVSMRSLFRAQCGVVRGGSASVRHRCTKAGAGLRRAMRCGGCDDASRVVTVVLIAVRHVRRCGLSCWPVPHPSVCRAIRSTPPPLSRFCACATI